MSDNAGAQLRPRDELLAMIDQIVADGMNTDLALLLPATRAQISALSEAAERIRADAAPARDDGMVNGAVIACAIIYDTWGDEVQVTEVLQAMGITDAAMALDRGCDRYDVRKLVPVFKNMRRRAALSPSTPEAETK